MNIGIDARMSGTKHGGIGRYIETLIFELPKQSPNDTFTIICKPDTTVPNYENVTILRTSIHWYTVAEQILLPFLIHKLPIDIMHFPHWNVPLCYRKPYLVTIHDLILQHIPAYNATTHHKWIYAIKHALYNLVLKNAAKTAKKIITVSNFSKQDIGTILHVAKEKIEVTPLFNSLPKNTQRNPVSYPYFLSVGVSYPHKNIDRLIRIFGRIHDSIPHHLVIIGPQGPFSRNLERLIALQNKKAREKIHVHYHVTNELLAQYYPHTDAFLFPSSYEGFGIPLLEAQAAGALVIANQVTAIPEVAGDGALYTDDSEKSWEKIIYTVAHNKKIYESIIKKGEENEKKYTMHRLISSTLQIYHQITKKGV